MFQDIISKIVEVYIDDTIVKRKKKKIIWLTSNKSLKDLGNTTWKSTPINVSLGYIDQIPVSHAHYKRNRSKSSQDKSCCEHDATNIQEIDPKVKWHDCFPQHIYLQSFWLHLSLTPTSKQSRHLQVDTLVLTVIWHPKDIPPNPTHLNHPNE